MSTKRDQPSYPVPPPRVTVASTTEPAEDVPSALARPVSMPLEKSVGTVSANSTSSAAALSKEGRTTTKTNRNVTAGSAAGAVGESGTGQKVYSPEEIEAAAADARRTLQQPRFVALAAQEQRAKEAAEEKIRQRVLGTEPISSTSGGDGDGAVKQPATVVDLSDADEQTAEAPKPKTKAPAAQKRKSAGDDGKKPAEGKKQAPKQRPSATPSARVSAPPAEPPQSPALDKDSSRQSLVSMAVDVAQKKERAERQATKDSIVTVKALLKQFDISTRVVPVLSMDQCSACDYIVMFGNKASVENHLPHVVRALCVAGMKVTYTKPVEVAKDEDAKGEKAAPEAGDVPPSAAKGSTGAAGKAGAEGDEGEEVVMKRMLRNMYCFLVEAVPVSGNVEVVALHVTLRPGMHDIFYNHYIAHYNDVAEASGMSSGAFIDAPFPQDAADLTDAQKKRLMHQVVDHLVHEKAAVPSDNAYVTMFPAHVDAMRDKIWEHCIGNRPWKLWHLIRGTDETSIAAYFGEETMFYFAWMNHYQRWLAAASVLALLGLFCGGPAGKDAVASGLTASAAAVTVVDPTRVSKAALSAIEKLNGTVLNATAAVAAAALFQDGLRGLDEAEMADGAAVAASQSAVGTDYSLPVFILLLIMGTVLCIKMWERRCNTLCMQHHLFQAQLKGKDELRPEFRGRKGVNPITKQAELQFPSWVRGFILQPLSWLVIAAFAALTIFIMVCFVNLEGYTAVDGETDEMGFAVMPRLRRFSLPGCLFDKAHHPVLGLLPTVVYSVCIATLSVTFTKLAEKLTDFENYKYRGEYIRALTQKRVVFEFINSYGKLFFLALVRHRITDLSTSLRIIFCTAVFTRFITGTLLPFMKTHKEQVVRRMRQHKQGKQLRAPEKTSGQSAVKTSGDAPAEGVVAPSHSGHGGSSDSALDEADERLEIYEVYTDYVEMAIQFGYIVLFAVAFPLAPLVAYLSNIIEIRSDLFKLCYVVRRPVPRLGLAENHTWVGVFRVMAIASVMTNMILLAIGATPMIARFLPSCFAYRYTTAYVDEGQTGVGSMAVVATPVLIKGMGRFAVFDGVVVEHLVLGAAVFLFWRISAFPKRVSVYIERKQYERTLASK